MDHTVILLWVLLSATAYTTTGQYEPTPEIPSTAQIYSCGQAFSDPSRSFIGPYYDGGRNVIECLWTIHSNDYMPIKATIDYVELDCDHEYINIYNGEVHHSTLLGNICSGSSWTFVSFTGTMSVLLHRDSYYTGPGFFAYYDIGELESTTAELTAVSLSTQDLELTSSAANPEVAQTTETTEIRTTAAATMETISIPPSTLNNATSTASPTEESTAGIPCGGIFTAPSGYLYGPSYPGHSVSMECIWEIQAAPYDHVALQFDYVSYNLNCITDYIVIYDGVLGSRQLGRICSDPYDVYMSTSNRMTIVLYRNSYQAGEAFSAYYYSFPAVSTLPPTTPETTSAEPTMTSGSLCGGILTAPSGYIDSPYYPGNNVKTECIWEIQTASYSHIVLDIYYVNNLNCHTDYIVIYDGSFGARQLGRVCFNPHHVYISTSSIMTIVLYRNSYQASPAFSAYYYSSSQASTVPPAINETATPFPTTKESTSVSVNQCGGNLSLPFGSLSGPYYSGNNVSLQCVWEIEVSPLDHIVLHFSNIGLDCNSEYVEIFDGHLYSSYLLGRICSGIYLNYTYTSTSNTITILLHRDSDLSGYGFDAYYYSVQDVSTTSAPPDNETAFPPTTSASVSSKSLTCSGEYMVARIRRTYLRSIGYDAWEVYLNSSGPLCKPQITLDYVIFNIPFSGCGTVRQERNNGTIIYSNIIKTSASGYIITRKRNFQFHILCEMNENTIVETMFTAQNSVDITEKHVGSYSINLGFFPSSSFSHEVHSYPYHVLIDQELYFQATLNSSDPNLVLFLDTCVASPYAHDFKTLTYDLIRSGCPQDPTYRSLHSPSNNALRFKFSAFKFLYEHNDVFLQCKLVVCMANDYSSRCYQGCLSRKKRTTDEDENKVNVVLGPFRRQEKANEDKRQELVKSVNPGKDEAVSPLTVATVLLAAMVFALSGFLLSSKLRRKSYQQIY